jgi:hypothetical protein
MHSLHMRIRCPWSAPLRMVGLRLPPTGVPGHGGGGDPYCSGHWTGAIRPLASHPSLLRLSAMVRIQPVWSQ